MEAHAADLDHALVEGDVAASFEARDPRPRRTSGCPRWRPAPTRRTARARSRPAACARRSSATATGSSHSKSFRRLKHKTQVFIAPEGDHYRTRLTHTIEACGISRTVARALRLNEDLTEAIGLGHDLGHPPFGHAGEEALDRALHERFGRRFRHNEHSLRVVDVLERDGRGLNLTEPVRDGILRHTGPGAARHARGPDRAAGRPDRLHQPRHRRRAARRRARRGRPAAARRSRSWAQSGSERIDLLVHDLVEHSERAGDIVQGERGRAARWRACASSCSSASTSARRLARGAAAGRRGVIEALFDHYLAAPGRRSGRRARRADDLATRVTDYLAGMTDRFCIRDFERLTVPRDLSRREPRHRASRSSASAHGRRHRRGRLRPHRAAPARARASSGLCPFHDERTPSLLGRPGREALLLLRLPGGRRRLHLPGGEGGARLPRGGRAARRPLRRRAGVRAGGSGDDERRRERERLLELLSQDRRRSTSATCGTPTRRRARAAYLESRGLEPRGARGVRRRLRAERLGPRADAARSAPASREQELHAAGLGQRGRRGGIYDRFRARIMFPLRDARGRVLGFGARAMRDNQQPKYVNSPEGAGLPQGPLAVRHRPRPRSTPRKAGG